MEVENEQEKKIVKSDKDKSNLKLCAWIDLVHNFLVKNNLKY
jgi:hypothetical protein